MKQEKLKISSIATKLQDLHLPYLEVILEEVFLLPPAFLGGTPLPEDASIADLIAISGIKTDEVLRGLRELQSWSMGLELSSQEFTTLRRKLGTELVCFDLRFAEEQAEQPWPGAQPINPLNFAQHVTNFLKEQQTLVIASNNGKRAFSGALYLKYQGIRRVHFIVVTHGVLK